MLLSLDALRQNAVWITLLTLILEAVTCFFRFGLGLKSAQTTYWIANVTFGFRIHHGYIGVVMLLAAFAFMSDEFIRVWFIRIGATLLASDLIHHFIILWLVTGSPEFEWRYPDV